MPPHTRTRPLRRRIYLLPYTTTAATLLTTLSWLPSALAQKSAADYYISSLPGAPSPLLKMWAGHIEVTPQHHGNLFFWLYKNRHIANRSRTVLWLNGGPGCSSMDGALMEVGPYRVNEDGTLRYNDGSWDEFANILFVDNPVGTGFSYVDGDSYIHELDTMAQQMVSFLEHFFALFPEVAADDLYIAGESYAGQHIPYVAKAILDRNDKVSASEQHWNLAGLLIGNGWISGPAQYPAYLQFAYESGLIKSGSGGERSVQEQQKLCLADLDRAGGNGPVDSTVCEGILQDILRVTMDGNQCINMYDVRLHDAYPSCGMNWPPDLKQVTPYLRREDVTRALHINPDKKTGWEECNGQVSNNFRARNSKPSVELLPGLLEKVPIVLFSGDQDLICNHIGTENLISTLAWNGGTGMETEPGLIAPRRDWEFENEPAGTWQEARNLTYVKFYNSSHMVPFDYPRRTRDMLDRFMNVDIASIGGTPADSRIDGEKSHPETSVGGHPNSTSAEEIAEEKANAAAYRAYQRSGEVVLTLMLITLAVIGFFWYRARRRRAGYKSVFGSDPYDGPNGRSLASGLGLDGHHGGRFREAPDVEAAREYDESELDDLNRNGQRGMEGDHFGLGDDEEDEDEELGGKRGTNGVAH